MLSLVLVSSHDPLKSFLIYLFLLLLLVFTYELFVLSLDFLYLLFQIFDAGLKLIVLRDQVSFLC